MLFPAATNYHALYQYYGHAVTNLGMAALGPGLPPTLLVDVITRDGGAERRPVLRMQQVSPTGAAILERPDYPFLLDCRRNNVLIADWPGGPSLPPGMPIHRLLKKIAA